MHGTHGILRTPAHCLACTVQMLQGHESHEVAAVHMVVITLTGSCMLSAGQMGCNAHACQGWGTLRALHGASCLRCAVLTPSCEPCTPCANLLHACWPTGGGKARLCEDAHSSHHVLSDGPRCRGSGQHGRARSRREDGMHERARILWRHHVQHRQRCKHNMMQAGARPLPALCCACT